MMDDTSLRKTYLKASFGEQLKNITVKEIAGLETTPDPIEYRTTDHPNFSTKKTPGLMKSQNVILKNLIFPNSEHFFNWFNNIKMNTLARERIMIQLVNEVGRPLMCWKLNNAWPVKVSMFHEQSTSDDIIIESIEIAHEGIELEENII